MFTKVERFQNMFYFERNCTKNSIIQHITHTKQKCLENIFKGKSTPQKTFKYYDLLPMET